MAQQQQQQQQYAWDPVPLGVQSVGDMYVDFYVVTHNDPAHTSEKDLYYFVSYDKKENKVIWSRAIKKAKEFSTRKQAEELGQTIQRPYFIKEEEDWYFGGVPY